MNLISLICFIIIAVTILSCFGKAKDIFSPTRLFVFIWSLAIGLAELKFSRFQHQWSVYGWVVLLLSISSFLIGVFAVYVIYYKKEILSFDEIRKIIQNTQIDQKKFYNVIVFLFVAYIISYVVIAIIRGYIPILSNHPSESRTQGDVFGFGLIIHAATSIMFFIVQYLLLIEKNHSKKITLVIILFITFITYFALLQRYDLVFWIIISLVFYYYSRKVRIRSVFIFVLGLLSIMYAIQNIRLSKYFTGYLYVFSEMRFSPKYAIFTEPYMYIVMNLENFTNAVTKITHHTFGYFTFNFIMSLTGLKHWIQDYSNLNDTPFLNSGYNTYTMFWDFYRDFGVLGLGIISFSLGFLISTLYYNFRTKPNQHTLSLYSIGVFVILFSFFINPIGQLHFFFNTSLIFFITFVTLKKTDSKKII
ncbi:MAG: O-antigen polymerase [Ignavibacteriaceae bacterium]